MKKLQVWARAAAAAWRTVKSSRAADVFAKFGSLFVLLGTIAVLILVALLTRHV